MGNACAPLLSDNEKASSVIQDAVEESSGGDLITLAGYAANAGDGKLAASLISQNIAKFNRFAQFQELAEQMTVAGNAAAAKIRFPQNDILNPCRILSNSPKACFHSSMT